MRGGEKRIDLGEEVAIAVARLRCSVADEDLGGAEAELELDVGVGQDAAQPARSADRRATSPRGERRGDDRCRPQRDFKRMASSEFDELSPESGGVYGPTLFQVQPGEMEFRLDIDRRQAGPHSALEQ